MAPSKHLVLVCGFARAGKDTFARGLKAGATNHISNVAFADSLKEALRNAAKDIGITANYHLDADKLQDRDLLVEFGRAMRRRHKDVFARNVTHNLATLSDDHTLVVTDWRYLNEYAVMKEACDRMAISLHTVQIVRNGWNAANSEEAMSMQEIIDAVPFDETVYAMSGDEESVLLHGYRIAKLWKL